MDCDSDTLKTDQSIIQWTSQISTSPGYVCKSNSLFNIINVILMGNLSQWVKRVEL